jgi:NAD(P)-dependent dehydrogenase (short-subunit alcohol dehydrogenase family)
MKKFLITGSSKGLGFAIAKFLIAEGHEVVLNGRYRNSLTILKNKIKNVKYVSGNFSKPNESKKIINKSVKILGRLDGIVCNIGSSKSCKPSNENYNEWIKTFNQNFFSTTNAIESSKKYLLKSKGSIICISSICGNEFIRNAPITYSTAKAALNFYAKSLSHYLGPKGVRINIISPGNLLFNGSVWEKKLKKNPQITRKIIKDNVPMNVFIDTDQIANLVSYLFSDKAKYINGAIFTVDGGQTIKL